jgi:amidophosphoribosyltransferase
VKLNPNREVLEGRRVVVVDDSIVRGTTSRKIVKMIRDAGAREVHMRISSPPTTSPCYYGIDTPTKEELIASSQSQDGIRAYLNADSLAYLSIPGMYGFVKGKGDDFCDACFTGDYPIALPDQADNSDRQLSLLAESH